jgi:myo-inositol 2-dehydrogenase / D-chiro-inositol 1-dehydrogenase
MNWYMGKNPVSAIGWGGRQRRVTGDQYDFFSIEYVYENGIRTHCAARQINGCTNRKVEQINGTKGYANAAGIIYDWKGNEIWKYPKPEEGDTTSPWKVTNPFVQEHINLVTAVRTGNTISDAEAQVNSTLITIMGRIAAYTGKEVTWEELMNSDLYLGPKTYVFGPLPEIKEVIPVVGEENVAQV